MWLRRWLEECLDVWFAEINEAEGVERDFQQDDNARNDEHENADGTADGLHKRCNADGVAFVFGHAISDVFDVAVGDG